MLVLVSDCQCSVRICVRVSHESAGFDLSAVVISLGDWTTVIDVFPA
jgi:hypothetical protein